MQNHLTLMLLAIGLSAAASFVTLTVFSHLLMRSSGRHGPWLALAASCCGFGFWAAHVSMSGTMLPAISDYSAVFAGLSLATVLGFAAVGIAVAARAGRRNAAAGGALLGLGLALGHGLGLIAFDPAGTAQWAPMRAVFGAGLGVLLAAAATLAFREYLGRLALGLGATLLTAAMIVTLLTVTSAVTLPPAALAQSTVTPVIFATAAAFVATLILLGAYIAALLDGWTMRAMFSRLELIDAVMEGIVIAEQGKVVSANARLLAMTGHSSGELVGRPVFGDLIATGSPHAAPGATVTFDGELHTKAGIPLPAEIVRRPLDALGRASEVYSIRDLRERIEAADRITFLASELKQAQQDLRRRNFLLESVLSTMSEGLCMFDVDQRVVIANERYATLYGLPPDAARPGTLLRDIIQKRIDKGLYSGESPQAYMDERLALGDKTGETLERLSDKRLILGNRHVMPGGGWVTTHEDVTERRRIEAQNAHLTQHDSLTGLPNRDRLRRLLTDALDAPARARSRLVVLMIDLDHFREINDTLGHAKGDALLKMAADRLRGHARKSTILGRFGDDEFVLIEAVDKPERDAAALADRIQEELRLPFRLDGKDMFIDSAIGIAIGPTDGADAAALLKSADVALYRAKKDARGSYRFFEPGMDRKLKERLAMEQDLAEALANNQFELHFQPLVSLPSNQISGFEALLRWQHPHRGLIPPAKFLSVAEGAGLLRPIEEWTLRQACAEAVQWPSPLKLAVNVSHARFKAPNFVPSVINVLAASGLNAERLEIEVSEKVIQADPDGALTTLRQLADLGVRIALDDFGTGFASLNYLRQFPIKRVKVDRSFVSSLTEDGQSQIIMRTLARLGAGFGVATTAEGVETQEQFDLVRSEGYTEMQGFFFSPPRTAADIRRLFLQVAESAA